MTGPRRRVVRVGLRLGLLVALLVGCAGRAATAASPPSPEPPVATPPRPMTPSPDVPFADGPAIDDQAALRAWLAAAKADRRRVRLPVVVVFDALGVQKAWIGNGGDAPADGAVLLKLDDTAMGVSLLDRLRQACPARTCAVWLEGTWGPVLEVGGQPALALPGFDSGPPRETFAVRRFVGLADATATRTREEVR